MKTELEIANERILELEEQVKKLTSNTVLADSKPRHCPKCNSTNVIMFDSDNDLCNDCGAYFC
jgi:ribosomal protein L37AE/L43A